VAWAFSGLSPESLFKTMMAGPIATCGMSNTQVFTIPAALEVLVPHLLAHYYFTLLGHRLEPGGTFAESRFRRKGIWLWGGMSNGEGIEV
jgi:hypothetical protein